MGQLTGYEAETQAVLEYYANLLILQYRNKPKAREDIKHLVNLYLADGLVFQFQDLLDVDKAVGSWLDLIGKIVGAPRNVPDLGLLDDDDYRILIKFKILKNIMRASNKEMDDALYALFGGEVLLNNNQDLSINYIVASSIDTPLQAALMLGYLTSPAGIEFGYIIKVPDPLKIFGCNTKKLIGKAVGFSTKDQIREGQFLTKDNLIYIQNII